MKIIAKYLILLLGVIGFQCSSEYGISTEDLYFSVCGIVSTNDEASSNVYSVEATGISNHEISFRLSSILDLDSIKATYHGYFECFDKIILIENSHIVAQLDFNPFNNEIHDKAKIMISADTSKVNWQYRFTLSDDGFTGQNE